MGALPDRTGRPRRVAGGGGGSGVLGSLVTPPGCLPHFRGIGKLHGKGTRENRVGVTLGNIELDRLRRILIDYGRLRARHGA